MDADHVSPRFVAPSVGFGPVLQYNADVKQLSLVRLLKFRLWLSGLVRPREVQVTLFWAGIVGLIGGLCGSAFRGAIGVVQWFLTGQVGGLVQTAMALVWWQRLLVPAVGALGAGLVIHFGSRFARGQSSSDYMEALVLGDGIIPPRPTAIKVTSSLLTIASGGSIGREGPMVQLSAMMASWLGQILRLPTPRLRLLVACGVAAGIASAYKVPIAGSLFVAEIVLGSIAMESFGPLVFSAVIATLTVRHFTDPRPLYSSPGVPLSSSWQIVPFMILGLLAGLAAPMFLRLLRSSEKFFAGLPLPIYGRLFLGGLAVGAISVFCPEVWGNGYSVLTDLLDSKWGWQALGIILVCKVLATAATVGSGAVGGVFTPTLFVGAVLGFLFEQTYHTLWPAFAADSRAYALVGMGCFLAATTHAPLMAIIMMFEMTLDYDIILPLMLACVTAYYTAYGLDRRSIYTEALARKAARAPKPRPQVCVGDLIKGDVVAIAETAPLVEIALAFARTQHNHLYVVDAMYRLRGAISLNDIKDFLNEPFPTQLVAAYDIMNEGIPAVTPGTGLGQAAQEFTNHRGERLPVIDDPVSRKLIGSISKTDLLLTLAHGIVPNGDKATPSETS